MTEQQTAYAQSLAAARALMETAQAAQSELDRHEQHTAEHKRAARVWFDLLEELDPPENSQAYWELVASKINRAYNDNNRMPLLRHMLLALMGYLEEVGKDAGTTQ